jgi:hypothetical protein
MTRLEGGGYAFDFEKLTDPVYLYVSRQIDEETVARIINDRHGYRRYTAEDVRVILLKAGAYRRKEPVIRETTEIEPGVFTQDPEPGDWEHRHLRPRYNTIGIVELLCWVTSIAALGYVIPMHILPWLF